MTEPKRYTLMSINFWMTPARPYARFEKVIDLADILGITHYNPPEPPDDGQTEKPTVRSKTLKGFIYRLLRPTNRRSLPGLLYRDPKDR